MFKYTDDALKLFLLEETNFLGVSISMFMLEMFWTIINMVSLVVLGINIYTTSLIDTTIQYGGNRERSVNSLCTWLINIYNYNWLNNYSTIIAD